MRFVSFIEKIALCLLAGFALVVSAAAQQDVIQTVIGGGPNNMPATDANLNAPQYVAYDAQGNYYIAAYYQNRVFKVDTTGKLTVLAGNGYAGYSGDGGPATSAMLSGPQGVAADSANPANVYIADYSNCVVRVVSQSTGMISTFAGTPYNPNTGTGGCGWSGDGGPATSALMYNPIGLALASNGDLYISEWTNGVIRKVSGGNISTVVGANNGTLNGNCVGTSPYGDGGLATKATLCYPGGVALDNSVSPPNILISDGSYYYYYNRCVVREVVASNGDIYRVAGEYYDSGTGTGGCGYTKDGVKATSSTLYDPYQLQVQVVSGTQTVTVADYENARVRQFTVTAGTPPTVGNISTVAGGNGLTFCGDGGSPTSACLGPVGLAFDSTGNMLIGDSYNNRVRKITSGTINTVAGWGPAYSSNPANNDGNPSGTPPLSVALYQPFGVFVDSSENVFVADASNDDTIREWLSGGNVNTFAGNGVAGFMGDGSAANGANTELNSPAGTARDSNGNTYIADTNNCLIRVVHTDGTIHTFAGGTDDVQNGCSYSGDGGPATSAQLYYPYSVAVDSNNNVYIADTYNHRVREVLAGSLNIITVAGNGTAAYGGDGGPATSAMLYYPSGVAVDGLGDVFIADTYNQRVREVNALTGIIDTVAGNGTAGFSGDGPATQNTLYYPDGLAVDAGGDLFIADTSNQRLRWVDSAGNMLSFAGNGGAGFSGDGGVATSAMLGTPTGVTVDSSGNFYDVEQGNGLIRKINAFAAVNRSTGSLEFGIQPVNVMTATPQVVGLTALGPLNISSITTSGDYSETDDCTTGAMTNGQTCSVYVYFTPTASGTRVGTLTINDNGFFSAAQTVSLEGEGTALSSKGAPAAFGSVIVGTSSAAKTLTLTNGGTSSITLKSITITDSTNFTLAAGSSSPCPLGAGSLIGKASCTLSVTFNPKTIGVKRAAVVVASTDPASPLLLGVNGTGSSYISISPSPVKFTKVQVLGTTSTATKITVSNSKTNPNPVTLTSVVASANYTVAAGTTCMNNTVLNGAPSGGSCVIELEFSPSPSATPGTIAGTLTINDNDPGSPQVVSLTGTATQVSFSPTSVAFPTTTKGTTANKNVTLTNVSTTTALTLDTFTITGPNNADFGGPNTNPPCSGSIPAGSNCVLTFTFTPSMTGVKETATFSLYDNGGASPQTLALSGTGK